MANFGASSNVMRLSVCRRMDAKYTPSDTHITKVDHSNVKVLEEIKDVLIRLASNPSVYQIIDIVVADILDPYGLFFSMDWSQNLNGFFTTYWSTLWLPKNGKANKIKIGREILETYCD